MKKLVLINGVMGVGKTTISKVLYKKLEGSFWLDGDNCWMMNPFVVDNENKKMVLDNIGYILNNYLKNSKSKFVIFNWVMDREEIIEDVLKRIENKEIKIYKITLMCEENELIERIKRDINEGKRDLGNIERSREKFNLYKRLDTIKVDTSGKNIEEITGEILKIIE